MESTSHQLIDSLNSLNIVGVEKNENVVIMEMDTEILLFGSFLFLGIVFLLGLIVNLPAAIIYCQSRQIRGFTDKFILFVLIVDLLSLFIFIPISFIFVFEYYASVDGFPREIGPSVLGAVPSSVLGGGGGGGGLNLDGNHDDQINNPPQVGEDDELEFSSFCVQQWIFLIHKLIFIMAANLSVLGALKIAVERYLAVVAPLHYHKILKHSVLFFVSLFSFVLSLASAVITAVDPADFSGSFLLGGKCKINILGESSPRSSSSLPWSPSRVSKISMTFDSESEDISSDSDDILEQVPVVPYQSILQNLEAEQEGTSSSSFLASSSVAFWWWPVLKLCHAFVFFLVPITLMLFMYLRIRTEARKQNHRMSCRSKNSFILPPPPTVPTCLDQDAKKSVSFSVDGLHQVFGKFKLMQRIKRKTRMDRAARVAVLTIGLSTVCFGPLFFVQIFSAVISLTKSHLSINPWDPITSTLEGTSPSSTPSQQFAKFLLPTLLACLHPLLSPLVYVYRYKRVREELKVLLRKMISRCCCYLCCCCYYYGDNHKSSQDCQEVIRQFNQMASQKGPSSLALTQAQLHHQIILESQICVGGGGGDDHDLGGDEDDYDEGDLVCVGIGGISQEDPHENHISPQNVISVMRGGAMGNGFIHNFLNSWMGSYSRRWNQHRESVTSTASFITLLSNRSRSMPTSSSASVSSSEII